MGEKLAQLNITLCNYHSKAILLFRIGMRVSNITTLNTGAPQGCVLSPLLFTLLTHYCIATRSSHHIIEFADDTTVLGLIRENNEALYKESLLSS